MKSFWQNLRSNQKTHKDNKPILPVEPILPTFLSETNFNTRSHNKSHESKQTITVLSQLFFEVYNLIVNKIDTFVERHQNDINKVVFIIGETGAGKTTTFLSLLKKPMESDKVKGIYKCSDSNFDSLIGHNSHTSWTVEPNLELNNNNGVLVIDYPGFSPTQGYFVSYAIEAAFFTLIQKHHKKSVFLFVESINNVEARFLQAYRISEQLKRFFKNYSDCCVLGLTHYLTNINYETKKDLEEEAEKLRLEGGQKGKLLSRKLESLQFVLESFKKIPEIEASAITQLEEDIREKTTEFVNCIKHPESDSNLMSQIQEHKNELQERERQWLQLTNITHLLRFSELNDLELMKKNFDILCNIIPISIPRTNFKFDVDWISSFETKIKEQIYPQVLNLKTLTQSQKDEYHNLVKEKGLIWTLMHPFSDDFIRLWTHDTFDQKFKRRLDNDLCSLLKLNFLSSLNQVLNYQQVQLVKKFHPFSKNEEKVNGEKLNIPVWVFSVTKKNQKALHLNDLVDLLSFFQNCRFVQ